MSSKCNQNEKRLSHNICSRRNSTLIMYLMEAKFFIGMLSRYITIVYDRRCTSCIERSLATGSRQIIGTRPSIIRQATTAAAVKMNKVSHVVILLASAAVGAQAQGICSCSPTIFNFVLDLNNYDCEVNTIKGNPGVLTAMCFQEFVDAVPGQPASDEILRRLLRDSEHDEENEPRRSLQIPENIVEVVSAQFLEFGIDGDMTVINQDNTYLTTSLMDGGAMQFYSVSSELDTSVPLEDQLEDPALVPGGASLIMYAKTGSGKVVRNRFFWLYEMTNCGRDNNPVQVGNQIGWVKVVSVHKTDSIHTRNI